MRVEELLGDAERRRSIEGAGSGNGVFKGFGCEVELS